MLIKIKLAPVRLRTFAFFNLLLWCVHGPDGDGELSRCGFALPHQEYSGVLPLQTLFSLKSGHTSYKPPTDANTSLLAAFLLVLRNTDITTLLTTKPLMQIKQI